jgi:hypothetical protein
LLDTARTGRRRAFFAQLRAEAEAFIGDAEGALAALQLSADSDLIDVFWMDRCPLFDALRADAPFAAIRERVARRAQEILAALSAPA